MERYVIPVSLCFCMCLIMRGKRGFFFWMSFYLPSSIVRKHKTSLLSSLMCTYFHVFKRKILENVKIIVISRLTTQHLKGVKESLSRGEKWKGERDSCNKVLALARYCALFTDTQKAKRCRRPYILCLLTKMLSLPGRYRDTIRSFWAGKGVPLGELASRISGSSDMYEESGRRPYASINFVTAHDGM